MAFAVCVMQSSLTCQFEHSGKVRSGLIGNFYFHCYQVRPHFLCAALMSSKRTKQHAVRRLSIYNIYLEHRWLQARVPGSSPGGDSQFFLQTFPVCLFPSNQLIFYDLGLLAC